MLPLLFLQRNETPLSYEQGPEKATDRRKGYRATAGLYENKNDVTVHVHYFSTANKISVKLAIDKTNSCVYISVSQ